MDALPTYDSAAAQELLQSLGDWCRKNIRKRPSEAVLVEMLQLAATGLRDIPPQLEAMRDQLPIAILAKTEELAKAQRDLAGEIEHAMVRWRLENTMLRLEPSLRKMPVRKSGKEKKNCG